MNGAMTLFAHNASMEAAEVFAPPPVANGNKAHRRPRRLTRRFIRRWKESAIMNTTMQLFALLIGVVLGVGCSTQNPKSCNSNHLVAATQGYLRLHNVEPRDIRYVLTQVAEAKQWERVSNDESGSYDPATGDDLVRATHIYRDPDSHNIRVDWAWEKGRDTLLLISTDRSIRESFSTAIGVNLLRHEQGLPLLVN
jgi:hypothetical protein